MYFDLDQWFATYTPIESIGLCIGILLTWLVAMAFCIAFLVFASRPYGWMVRFLGFLFGKPTYIPKIASGWSVFAGFGSLSALVFMSYAFDVSQGYAAHLPTGSPLYFLLGVLVGQAIYSLILPQLDRFEPKPGT